PCFATLTPMPAASSAAAVLMLNVVRVPPPVPQVSTSWSGSRASMVSIARRRAPAAPATSSAVSPFTRRPTRSAATCAGLASPLMMASNASPARLASSERPAASCLMAVARASIRMYTVEQPVCEPRFRDHECYHPGEQPDALHVGFVEYPLTRTVRQVHDPDHLVVVHELEADEGSGGEVLISQE